MWRIRNDPRHERKEGKERCAFNKIKCWLWTKPLHSPPKEYIWGWKWRMLDKIRVKIAICCCCMNAKTFYIKWKKIINVSAARFCTAKRNERDHVCMNFPFFLLFLLRSLLQLHAFLPLNVWKCSNDVSAGKKNAKAFQGNGRLLKIVAAILWRQTTPKTKKNCKEKVMINYKLKRNFMKFSSISHIFRSKTLSHQTKFDLSGEMFLGKCSMMVRNTPWIEIE